MALQEFRHKIGEHLTVVRQTPSSSTPPTITIRRVADGFYFNWLTKVFEEVTDAPTSNHSMEMLPFFSTVPTTLWSRDVSGLPKTSQDLLFIYDTGEIERRTFGNTTMASGNNTCIVHGTLLDVSGNPMSGYKVEAFLNNNGYFVGASGLVGSAVTAISDEAGYFELPLIMGLDVTISIPALGFTSKGKVPSVSSTELSFRTLLGGPC